MPDIFYSNPSTRFIPNQQNTNIANQSSKSFWDEKNAEIAQQNAEYIENLQKYSVNISQDQYNIIKDVIADAENPEDEAYRWASALELNTQYGMPVDYAYQNIEQITSAFWGEQYKYTPKTAFKAIVDSGKLGANTLKLGKLGSQIMKAEMFGQNEYKDIISGEVKKLDDMLAEYAALEQENTSLQDYEKRNFAVEALKFGAQSAPFTGYVMGAGLLGSLIAPGVGTAASFAASMDNAAGLEYMKLRQAGSDVGDAVGFAILSGGLQALVETSLGNVAGALGKKTLGDLASRAVTEKITGNLFKRLAYDGTFKTLALRMTKEWAKENVEEGLEEVIQDLIEKGTDALAAELGGYEIEKLDAKTIARDAWENFRGGLMGSLVLGLAPSVIKSKADIKDFVNVRNLAETVDSQETFNMFTDNSRVFEGMTTEEKRAAQKASWENGQARKEAKVTTEAKQIAEGRDAAEGAEERKVTVDENGEEVTEEAETVARDDNGKLFVQDEEYKDDEGKVTGGIYVTGDANVSGKEEGNRYGYIKYSQDENGDITIDTFKMTDGREGLRQEFFDQFAQEHPDVKIEWNPIGSKQQAIKEKLINENPSGAKNGLNYYTTELLNDPNNAARKDLISQISKKIHNVEPARDQNGKIVKDKNGRIVYKRTPLTRQQLAAAAEYFELGAKKLGLSLGDYMNKSYENGQLFGDTQDFINKTLKQGERVDNKNGGIRQGTAQINWQRDGMIVKHIIYAAENADFATFIHEVTHGFRAQLSGQMLKDAEAAFGVEDGNWDAQSKYKYDDGSYMTCEEAFAYFGQDYFITGKAPTPQMENIFKRLAEFLAEAYSRLRKHLNFTPEIAKVFDNLLADDDSVYNKALKAAREEENEYRASLKRQAEEAENAKKTAEEEAQKQAELEREEASETTDFVEKSQEMTVDQAEKQLEETNEKETNNAIDDALENLNISDEQKAQTAEVLKDETSTIAEKADAIADAAGEQFDLFQRQPGLLFQKIAEKLDNAKTIDVTTTDVLPDFVINFDKSNNEILTKAIDWGLEQIGTDSIENPEVGEIKFYKKGIRNSIFHGFKNPLKARLFKKLPEIIPNSVLINKEEESGKIKSYVLAGKINVEGTDYYVTTVVKVDKDGNKYYNHSTIKKSELGQRQTRKNAASQSRPDTISILQDILNVKQNEQDEIIQERDDEYAQAVESGDTEKAMQMLAEEAERKGYNSDSDYQGGSAFNGAAPSRNGYYDTKEERLQAIKDEEFEDTETLGDYAYDNADALGFDFLINDPRSYRAADAKRKEAIDNLRNAIKEAQNGKKDVTIKMHRSVPADIKENSFRNGDRITPSKSYAEENAAIHGWGPGEYRIIEQDADLENVWWDGNDIAEWGYDDGKEYAYKNTENNRKLYKITYDGNGNLIPLSERFNENDSNILFQTTPEEQQAADTYLETFKSAEKKRIKNNLSKFKDTPWYNSTIKSLNVRNEINDLLDGKEIAPDSELKRDILKTYYEVLTDGKTKEERIEHLYEYFECDSSLIGHPTKPINSVASSFINCNPSKECAKWCYAANGRNQMVNLIANRELVNWCIEHDPVRSAKMVADEYKDTREFKNGVALRLLDTGDLSAPWLDFIKELNDRGIACQIFSKRPDLLKQVDRQKNVILLSIDNSNTDVAAKNPDMPIAYVYSGAQDLEYIKNSEERFKQYGGVVLPVVINQRKLTKQEVNELPAWTKNYTCPIDAGWKEIGNSQKRKYNTDKWNCSVYDINGQGCFFARAVKDREKFYATLKEVPIGVLNAITEEYERFARSKLAALGLPESEIGSILAEMVNIRDQKLAGIDTEGTGRGSDSIRTTLPSAPGEAGSQKGKNGSSQEAGLKLHFQKVYHGSPYNFDKFSTENIGSGEGAQAFGWGLYFTNQENIARFYADKLTNEPKRISLMAKNDYLKSRKKSLKDVENKEKYEARILKNINHFEKELKQAQKENDESQIKFYEGLINDSYKQLDENERLALVESFKKDIEKAQQEIAELKASMKNNRNLYTVELPNNGYIVWDKPISDETRTVIYNSIREQGSENFDFSMSFWSGKNEAFESGEKLYNAIAEATGGEKQASLFLKKAGFVGINYPAHSLSGITSENERNYVIFNDDDVKIVEHLLYQTNAELMQEAQTFDTWQEFMDYCETFHVDVDEVSPIPFEADAQWYQSFWETAHGLQTEQEKNEQAVQEKVQKDGTVPAALDALFITYIRQNPEMLDDFLHEVARLDEIDLNSDEWRNVEDDMQAAERDKIDTLKDAIAITMSDNNWQSAMRRIQGGGEISEGMRKRLMGEMTDTMKARDFRALYAEVMEDPQYAVDEEDTTSAMLSKKLQKYQKRYYDIVKPGEDISKMSPEKRKRIAEAMANRDIANKIRNGSLKLDDELDAYIKSLDRQIKEKQKQFDELEKETKADYQRIADAERRRLLKLHEELLLAKAKVTQKNSDTARKINKGLKITEKYKRESQNLQANYDELFRKFNDLKNTIQITAEVQAALDRQEQVANVREDLNSKQKEKNLTAEVKKMRIQLVKKTMRRVPFNRIDYENAKTIIAIQRMLEPNLIGGVNKFIGIDSVFLRGVISQIVTDSDYKAKILNYLAHNSKSSEAFLNFKKKLQEMKSIKDFDSWTAKERKAAIKYLPKENWVRDLNLKELAKEREESIDLDIDTEEYSRPVYDEHGKIKTYKDAEGIEHNVTETAFRLRYSDELGQLVKDAVGADMFDRIINRPFSEWTTEELEQLAQRIDELYTEGRDLLAAKNEARRKEAEAIRKRVEDAIKDTGIVINDDDTPEEKERKQKEINKILNLNSGLKGTEAGKDKGVKAKLDRLIHGYSDMNMLRFARMLDNQSEGENVYMLYRKEDECYNNKTRSINNRARAINEIMKANKITEGDLAKSIAVPELGTEFTVDELLYFLAADKDYAEDETKLAKGFYGLDANDDWAATSRNAVMFGNMMSDTLSQEQKEKWVELDKAMQEALKNDTLTAEEKQLDTLGRLDKTPGTTAYISYCHAKWEKVLAAANSFITDHPEYKALMEAIEADYASQYERMNEVSINEFNMPVHRVKAYVPLVRRESNGDTNVNQVKEDLLGAYGADAGKQWVNKGMTQRRVNISPLNQKPVQTGLFATWGSSVDRTEHFIAYASYVRQLNAVYKSRDAAYTRRFLESRYGKYAVEYLDNYINEVANPNVGKVREAGSEFLHALRGRTAPAYLGWKFSAIIKQGLTSPWPYMQFVNPAEYAAAALECTRKGTYDAIKEKSVFMHNRVMDPMNELIEEMAEEGKTKFDRTIGKFGKTGMQGLEWIDWVCVAPGWLACYKKEYARLQRASEARYEAKMEELRERNMYADIGTSQYMSPDQMQAQAQKEILEDIEMEAVRYADDCTRQCQPSSRAVDLAPLFKGRSEAMKAFLQFQTPLNVIWQNIRYDMPYAVRNKQFNRIVGTILGYVFAGIFMNSVMDGVTSGADDDDDKDLQALRNLIFYSTTQFTDAVPIMGSELTNMFDQVITGKRGFANSGTDMTPSATKMLSAFTNATKGNWKKAATLSAEAIGMGLGAPVSGVKEINKLLGKPLDEGDVNLLRGLGDVYGIAGDIIEE